MRKSAKKSVMVADESGDKKVKDRKREVHFYAQEIMADLEYRQQFKVTIDLYQLEFSNKLSLFR